MPKYNCWGQSDLQQITVIDHGTCFEVVGRWNEHYPKHVNDTLLRAVTMWLIDSGQASSVVSIDINGLCTYSQTICKPTTQTFKTSTHVFDGTWYTRRVFTNGAVNWSSGDIGHGEDYHLDQLYNARNVGA